MSQEHNQSGEHVPLLQMIELPELNADTAKGAPMLGQAALAAIQNVKVQVEVRVGQTRVDVKTLMALQDGAVLKLDRLADAPVDVLVDNHVVARGQLVAADDCFGVRITELAQVQGK